MNTGWRRHPQHLSVAVILSANGSRSCFANRDDNLGKDDMLIIGLTGSIGMGKSTTAAMFREAGVPVYDADAAVADLYQAGGAAVAPLEAAFPGVTKDGAVDREALRTRVLGDDEAMGRLNKIVHPLVGADRVHFFKAA